MAQLPVLPASLVQFYLSKVAKELTEEGRAHVKEKNFAIPEDRKYPIHDRDHAESALGFSDMHGTPEEKSRVRDAVAKKYPELIATYESNKEKEEKTAAPVSMQAAEGGLARFGQLLTGSHADALSNAVGRTRSRMLKVNDIKPVPVPQTKLAGIGLLACIEKIAGKSGTPKEKGNTWTVPQSRSGTRPMSVDTLLRKENDGTLRGKKVEEKTAEIYDPNLPFTTVADRSTPSVARRRADNIPDADQSGMLFPVKNEDGRSNAYTEMSPSTQLAEPAYGNLKEKMGGVQPIGQVMRKLANNYGLLDEHKGDMRGLGLMALSSADKLKSHLQHGEDEKGSLVGGTPGRSGMDLAGLALMTAPTIADIAKNHHENSRFTNFANLAGLTALAAPTIDNIQAGLRAKPGEDAESKMLMSHKAHAIAELAGLGTLAAPVIGKLHAGQGSRLGHAATLAGYGTLAAPVAEDLVQHDEDKKMFGGAARPLSELAGLALLGGGAHIGHASEHSPVAHPVTTPSLLGALDV